VSDHKEDETLIALDWGNAHNGYVKENSEPS
jgi:hypothetical protein